MNKINYRLYIFLVLLSFAGAACKTSFDEIKYSDGNASFERFVAIGSSYFAGYNDRALYLEGQQSSVPNILASRFALVGGGIFHQPDVKPGVGVGYSGNARYMLRYAPSACNPLGSLTAVPLTPQGDVTNFNWVGNTLPFNNFGVPVTKIADLYNQSFGNPSPFLGNPFYARFASSPSTSTIAGDALLANPTFVAIWMGMDDIYNYAVTGGEEGGDTITAASTFNMMYSGLVSEMTSQNEGGVLLNIPALNSIPYFTAIKWNGLSLNAAQAADLNNLYAGISSDITFTAGQNAYVIADANHPDGFRQIKNGEYILLSVSEDSLNCHGVGTTIPIPERHVLDLNEVALINAATDSYNNIIFNNASLNGVAYVDIHTLFKQLINGVTFNGNTFSTEYLYGGTFSTDGYNPSQRGAALIANEVLNTINRFYSAKIPLVDVNSYPAITFP
jgi:hypothetical protein